VRQLARFELITPRGCGPIPQSLNKRWGFWGGLDAVSRKFFGRLRYRSGHGGVPGGRLDGRPRAGLRLFCLGRERAAPFASRASTSLGVAVGRASAFSFGFGLEEGDSLSLAEQTRYEASQRGSSERFGFSTGLC
jgi:hypothetical protein